MKFLWCILLLVASQAAALLAADSVDVTFRYQVAGKTGVTVPGEFNSWNNAAWPMTRQIVDGNEVWTRTARLALGTYLYKFYYTGATIWPNDPLNPHVTGDSYQNSILLVRNPTIYQFVPNQRNPLVNTSLPVISAYVFPLAGELLDTSSLVLTIDGVAYTGIGGSYDFSTRQLRFTPPQALPNGPHTVILASGLSADTVNFTTRGGFVQLLNQFPFTTLKDTWTLNGTVEDSAVSIVRIVRNSTDTFTTPVAAKAFSYEAGLLEGVNTFRAVADSSGGKAVSSPVTMTRQVNHAPWAVISFGGAVPDSGTMVRLNATESSDPDTLQADSLTFVWSEDAANPEHIGGIDGSTQNHLIFIKPATDGEYYFTLVATDPDGNSDTTRNYFTVESGGSISYPTIASDPAWAKAARVYFLFPKAFTSGGTILLAAQKLQYIRDMGFNTIWLMPVMKNAFPIDNGVGVGYNIVDFYHVAPEYGTDEDLRGFIAQAHSLGLRVILDITPNHTSRFHPWSVDAHTYKQNSYYWNWYQHQFIPHNDNGLGQSADPDNFWYYSGFSDQLLNINWSDVDASHEFIRNYKYWIKQFGADGFRFDVYWGPHRRYGEEYMGKPVRDALKHIKPDILLLAEDDGTGSGTEVIYADHSSGGINGGVDAAYDFSTYFGQIRNFGFSSTAINNLQNALDNSGYYPGENALFMRFMETQDEDRIYYLDPNPSSYYDADPITAFHKTMPMASVIFTCPGFPMIWNGQEVGWGYGIPGSKIARNRSVINWDFMGKGILSPHYQKLAHIRGQFPAFTQHKKDTNGDGQVTSADAPDFLRVYSPNPILYAFARPFTDQNGLTAVNFSDSEQTATLNLLSSGALKFTGGILSSGTYYLNNLYENTREQLLGSRLDSVTITLPAFGTALYTVSLTRDSVTIENPITHVGGTGGVPGVYSLDQNYPNPFNPATTIRYSLPQRVHVELTVFDLLGRIVARLASGEESPGIHEVMWDAARSASGVYFYKLEAGSFTQVKKMVVVR